MNRIGLVLSQPPAYSETFFNSKIKGLQESGFQVILFVQSNPNKYNICSVKVGSKWPKNPFKRIAACLGVCMKLFLNLERINVFVQLERQVNKPCSQIFKNVFTNSHIFSEHIDWLHFGFATLAIHSEHVAKAIGAKMAVSLRGFDIDVYPIKHPDCYNLVWQQVDQVHAISNYLLLRAYSLGLSKETPVQIIYPAINLENFNWQPEKELSKEIKILTIARLHWMKGLTEILEALAILKQKGIQFKYIIIGSGELYESLCFTIHQLNLTDSVFLVGQKTPDEVIKELYNSDLYLQYSHSEGFCNAVLEAQAAGVLCVVSDGGGLPENILHEETGWVVPKREPKLLAKTILKILDLPNQDKLKIREKSKFRVENEFSLKYQKAMFNNFYNI